MPECKATCTFNLHQLHDWENEEKKKHAFTLKVCSFHIQVHILVFQSKITTSARPKNLGLCKISEFD